MCQSITQFIDYHAWNKSKYGVLRIPADGSKFRKIKEIWPFLKEEPRNVRISLATDGVNPFGELRSIYSPWPIFVINNKLPPWMSIKRERTMLAMNVRGIRLQKFFERTFHLSCSLHNFLYIHIYKVVMMCTFNQLGK
jgi:hypothetical protein